MDYITYAVSGVASLCPEPGADGNRIKLVIYAKLSDDLVKS